MTKTIASICVLLLAVFACSAQPGIGADFLEVVSNRSTVNGKSPTSKQSRAAFEAVCPIDKSAVARTLLSEYGAMFVASEKLIAPPTCRFQNDSEVARFQSKLETSLVVFNGVQLTLQKAAAASLNTAIADALSQGIRLRPLDGSIAGGRTYSETVRLWNSRFQPALRYWVARRRIPMDEAAESEQIPVEDQVAKVINWEAQGMRFGTNRKSSIFASTAPPGASQHLSLIAIDIAPPLTPTVITLMNERGWFQTVKGDRPHFTYLGLTESELPTRGLRDVVYEGVRYWVPNMTAEPGTNP